VTERRDPGELEQPERTPGPDREPTGALGGQPINADELAPSDALPDPGGGDPSRREPGAVGDEPGEDL
jgi:hypothetical protein